MADPRLEALFLLHHNNNANGKNFPTLRCGGITHSSAFLCWGSRNCRSLGVGSWEFWVQVLLPLIMNYNIDSLILAHISWRVWGLKNAPKCSWNSVNLHWRRALSHSLNPEHWVALRSCSIELLRHDLVTFWISLNSVSIGLGWAWDVTFLKSSQVILMMMLVQGPCF